ncbi:hypothetical protein GUJ93_ZPchr0002g23656 [Zizania palustris]|uniref:NAC domain-containing protein n=1 Tax=Zizania palustris TaxID=103762 RepID=A0A8J5S7U2_ZIZPA|nr:hypothetical protein GUJ93_ZPchr0002g23656 [Zizania palustris]
MNKIQQDANAGILFPGRVILPDSRRYKLSGWDHVKSKKESYYLSKGQDQESSRQDGLSLLHATGVPINHPPFPPHSTHQHTSISSSKPVFDPRIQSLPACSCVTVSLGCHSLMTLRQLPPGFRFHPTDEELVVQYLSRKALARPLPAAVIPDIHDAAVLDPWDLPGAGEGEAYFFCFRQAPASGRKGGGGGGGCRRRAGTGYWKPTGTEKPVFLRGFGCGGSKHQQLVGFKTTLAFHRAKPPSRTGWVMHEYRLAAAAAAAAAAEQTNTGNHSCMAQAGGEWVVRRIFLKNGSSRRRAGDADGQTPAAAAGGGAHGGVQVGRQPASSSSCVTDASDDDEVSSGCINGAPAAR